MSNGDPHEADSVVQVTPQDLPLHCPAPGAALWNAHPRVFLAIDRTGEARCPYCGTRYVMSGGALPAGH
ncbi:MAG: zinc-finger domain-containing protein [Betaproteobacteria bacterium]|jgi:uncharacterized Zn-finger protein